VAAQVTVTTSTPVPHASVFPGLDTNASASSVLSTTGATDASRDSDPYVAAANAAGLPVEMLVAVAGAESGFHPLALDVGGRQIYCRSRAEAEGILAANDRVDIGLMQINYPFWGRRLGVSKTDLLDPRTNLLCGAKILKQALKQKGTLWRRISDYHAGSRQERDRYNQKVYRVYLAYMRGQFQ
jgi:soluble lytic murein transglycosylase-like protein